MDRDRRSDREDTEWLGGGESYRPGLSARGGGAGNYRPPFERDRPISDNWQADRRDDRRDVRRDDVDSYIPPTSARARSRSPPPGGFRRRSRSPVDRGRDDNYVPARRFSPRRDDRPRSPPRRRSRSPYNDRARSPAPKRVRDYSPRRSPPKRERLASPLTGRYDRPRSPPRRQYSPPRDNRDNRRGGYRQRTRSPPRRNPYTDDNWRRRSPSPRASRPQSVATSRRSSPPIHPDRASLTGSVPRSPGHAPRNQYDTRPALSPKHRTRSPARAERSPPRSFPVRTRDVSPRPEYRNNGNTAPPAPPTGPGGQRNGNYNRPPPTGPSRGYAADQLSPPTGPSATPMSMSAHNRGGPPVGPSMLSAPTRPRGAPPGRFDGPSRDFSGSPRDFSGQARRPNPTYRAPSTIRSSSHDTRDAAAIPSQPPTPVAPRGPGGYGRGEPSGNSERQNYDRPSFGRGDAPPSFRHHNNSSSSTYPRTQRFNTTTQHLATNEKIVPGGKLLPSGMTPDQEKRAKQLEAEAEKLREMIEEKQRSKREALREWEVRERESSRESLKSELAEKHLSKLTEGEDGAGAAF